ncbi:MAG: metallophosphoesterase [Chthoniobacterales bacterium]
MNQLPRPLPLDSALSEEHREEFARRLGPDRFETRMHKQSGVRARTAHQGAGIFFMERFIPLDACIEAVIRFTGMYPRGSRNYRDVRIVTNEVKSPRIPAEFDGFRLLQISDLHGDLDTALTPIVMEYLRTTEYDYAVFTGDYHNRIGECYERSLEEIKKILPLIAGRACGILGNHDFLEKVPVFENDGMEILLNENKILKRGAAQIAVCGIDDPQFFRTHDLVAARRGVDAETFSILLSHSPKPYQQAADLGYDLMLCGHTHGGQICLPGRIPVIRNTRCPRYMLAGPWHYKNVKGYTSRGTGGGGVAVRFNCPPEITVHVLRHKRKHPEK